MDGDGGGVSGGDGGWRVYWVGGGVSGDGG